MLERCSRPELLESGRQSASRSLRKPAALSPRSLPATIRILLSSCSSPIKILPIIVARNHYSPAHFIEPGTKSRADAVFQHLFSIAPTFVEIIRRKDRQLFVVIAGIDDVGHRVADPVGWL